MTIGIFLGFCYTHVHHSCLGPRSSDFNLTRYFFILEIQPAQLTCYLSLYFSSIFFSRKDRE